MLRKYSNSPEVALRVLESRQRAWCYLALSGLLVGLLAVLYLRGYPWLLPGGVLCLGWLARLAREPLQGALIRWRRGAWSVEDAARTGAIEVTGGRAVGPVICLRWRYRGGYFYHDLVLFPDSADHEELRRLRRRLRLER